MDQDLKAKADAALKELEAKRDAFALKFSAALNAAGFSTEYVASKERHMPSKLTVKSNRLESFALYGMFHITGGTKWHNVPTKIELKWGKSDSTWRSSNVRYTRLDDAQIAKLVNDATETLQLWINQDEARKQSQKDEAHWEHERRMRLAGHIVPPGTRVSIVSGNGPDAGSFMIRFDGHNSIDKMRLTRDQLIRLMNVLNDIQGSDNACVIFGINQNTGEQVFFNGYGWMGGEPRIFPTRDDARLAMDSAYRDHGAVPKESIQIGRYTTFFTIKP